jgi:hypothetical protein
MKAMPFLYTDLRSRLVPGFVSLLTLGILGFRPPKPYLAWLSVANSITAVMVPLLIVVVSYILGDVIEVTIRNFRDAIDDVVFPLALKKHKETYPEFQIKIDTKSFRHQLWHWLTIMIPKDYPEAFIHAARFQSEAKMLLNSSLPLMILTRFLVLVRWPSTIWASLAGIGCLLACWGLAFLCERRRWLQALAARQLGFEPEDVVNRANVASV